MNTKETTITQSQREKALERIQRFRLMDDSFMTKVFEDTECTELMLRIIMEKDDLEVIELSTEQTIKSLSGRSARLDVYAKDSEGRYYNIEVQCDSRGAGEKRARFNSSIMDSNLIKASEKHENLPEVYVIFITEHDVLGEGLPIYNISRFIEQTGSRFNDGSHIIYVNGQIRNETALGKLMHDFFCTKSEDMHYNTLAKRVRYFKEDEEGAGTMCRIMEEILQEGIAEGKAEGIAEGKAEGKAEAFAAVAENLRQAGATEEFINTILNVRPSLNES